MHNSNPTENVTKTTLQYVQNKTLSRKYFARKYFRSS